jgi:hypothetical protein
LFGEGPRLLGLQLEETSASWREDVVTGRALDSKFAKILVFD